MDDRFRMRLYALTCVACAAWLVQAAGESMDDGTLASAPSVILLVCLAVAVVYTGVNAFLLWRGPADDADDTDTDGTDTTGAADDDKEAR